MTLLFFFINLFGPLAGKYTVHPLNPFRGFGMALPSAYALFITSNTDTTAYLVIPTFSGYYNLNEHFSVSVDATGRFEYVKNSDTSLNRIYPEVVKIGAKFGFPLTRYSDFGIGIYAGVPLYVLGIKDTSDLLGYSLAKRAYPGLKLLYRRYIGKFNLYWALDYTGPRFNTSWPALRYEGLINYKASGIAPFLGLNALVYSGRYRKRIPYDVKAFLGINFVSEFNAAFTIAFFIRPFAKEAYKPVFVPDGNFKYGVFLNIENWVVNKWYKRKFTPRHEKAGRLILVKRFVNVKFRILDSKNKAPLSSVKISFLRKYKPVKTIFTDKNNGSCTLKRGHYLVVVEKEKYIPDTLNVHLEKDTLLLVYLKRRPLKDTGWLILKITDAAGAPLQGATVKIVELGLKARSDSLGRVAFKLKSGKYLVVIQHTGYRRTARYFVVNKEERTRKIVRLRRKK